MGRIIHFLAPEGVPWTSSSSSYLLFEKNLLTLFGIEPKPLTPSPPSLLSYHSIKNRQFSECCRSKYNIGANFYRGYIEFD